MERRDSISLVVREHEAGTRLDRFIADRLQLSRQKVNSLEGGIRLNGRPCKKGRFIEKDDVVQIDTSRLPGDWKPAAHSPELLKVIKELDDIVFVEKPAGIHCHPLLQDDVPTLLSAVLCKYPEVGLVGRDPREGGLVHRLDKDTSGVVVFARNNHAYEVLRQAFKHGKISKEYIALVRGRVFGRGEITLDIGHHPSNPGKMVALKNGREKTRGRIMPAVTRYTHLAVLGGYTLVSIAIKTGRMHQIRLHMAAIGHPVAGDATYGYAEQDVKVMPLLNRHFLHAALIGIPDTIIANGVRVRSNLPRELAVTARKLVRTSNSGITPR
ncbi:MAG: RluA family pseudouridine synthase [Deltaproteobacteria bacterium]|nr:RluA family pseudouridine synthase [Deltaproteobacteria bacterium]